MVSAPDAPAPDMPAPAPVPGVEGLDDLAASPALINSIEPLTWTSHPFDGICHMIEAIHTMADVPYYGAIMLGTIGVRTLLLPLTIKVMQNGAKMQIAAPEIAKFKVLLEESKNGTQEERTQIMK